jgi:hypothetical protein
MAITDELKILVEAEVSKAISNLDKLSKTTDSAETKGSKLAKTFSKMRDVMQGPVAGARMLIGAIKGVAASIDSLIMGAVESERSLSNLKSTLKSTGSDMSLVQLVESAEKLSKLTLFDDDAINQAQAVLLTFKQIGQTIFPQATSAIADMATVMKMDLQSATVLVGKALNDPVQGLSALRRVGVQLTDAQEKLIKQFIDINDLASAQRVIIGELNSQFGGAAASAANTATGSYLQLKKAIGEVNEAFGKSLALMAKQSGITELFNDIADKISNETIIVGIQLDLKELKPGELLDSNNAKMAIQAIGEEMKKLKDNNQNIYGEWARGTEKQQRHYQELLNLRVRLMNMNEIAIKKEGEDNAKRKKVADDETKRIQDAIANEEAKERAIESRSAVEERAQEMIAEATQRQIDLDNKIIENKKALNAEAQRLAYLQGALWEEGAEGAGQYLEKLEQTEAMQKAITQAVMDQAMTLAEAFGTALITGEEGWKAFGKAGLNAIAAVITAFAKEWSALALAALVPGPTFNPAGAAGYAAVAAAGYAAAGLVKAIPMAKGGIVPARPGGTLALLGEAGRSEAVIPLGGNKGVGGVTYIVHGSLVSEKELSSRIRGTVAASSRDW